MQIIIVLFFGIIVGIGIALLLRTKEDRDMQFVEQLSEKKKEKMRKILGYFDKHPRVTNDEVEALLGVSNTTAYRYLEELEEKGLVRQVGRTGAGVFYEKK